jgi:hypothetical protein
MTDDMTGYQVSGDGPLLGWYRPCIMHGWRGSLMAIVRNQDCFSACFLHEPMPKSSYALSERKQYQGMERANGSAEARQGMSMLRKSPADVRILRAFHSRATT